MWIFGRQPVRALKANTFAVRALEQRCDPKPLLDLCRQADWWGDFKKIGPLIALNGVEALLAAGMADTALACAQAALAAPEVNTPDILCSLRLWESRALVQLERWPEAVRAQNQAMELFNGPLPQKQRDSLQWFLCWNGYRLQLHQGMTQDLEASCLQLLPTAPAPQWEVELHLLLGQLYLTLDRPQEAEAQLEAAVTQGNALYAKTQAQLLLCDLRGEAPSGALLAGDALHRLRLVQQPWAQECRFTPALNLCLESLANPEILAQADAAANLRSFAAAALINLGRYQEALDQLDQVHLTSRQRQEPVANLDLLFRRSVALDGLGRLEEAVQAQNQAMELFQAGGPGVENFRAGLTRNACFLQLRMGLLDGVESQAQALLDQAADQISRVLSHMLLGRYYLAAGRPEEARPHLEYAAQYGGEHHVRAEAQTLLNGLDQPS